MLKKFLTFLLLSFLVSFTQAQNFSKAANQAFVITRMINKYHILPKNIDEDFSKEVYKMILKNIDEDRILFTQEDIKQLEVYKLNLHEQVLQQKTNFLELLSAIVYKRLQQADSFVTASSKTKLNFYLPEIYTVKEDTSYPLNNIGARQKFAKLIKNSAAEVIISFFDELKLKAIDKKFADSLEPYARRQICDAYNRNIQKQLQFPGGVQAFVGSEYCNAIANYFDPHTEYFTITEKENFESALGKKNMVFGFNLQESNSGDVEINNLLPGSPAFKSGLINKGDKLIAIQWEGSKPIDVSNASVREISQILSASNHAKATLTFLKADGTKKEVTLGKELMKDDLEDDKVTSFILKGEKPVGYIALPAFYQDWEDYNSVNGCANDVAKEILKLKKESIAGLIIDLRYNGGGSVQEAVELAGIFIDAGPVGQIKIREPKKVTLKDVNRGTIYDGPLTILVNGFSASASELVAGVLQDYNRAVIIGSPTYGKATGQRVLPLDTTANIETFKEEDIKDDAVKITLLQLYQVSGKTAQFKGVIPDIILPDATDAYNKKERDEPFAIPSTNIEANKYYMPLSPLPLNVLKEKALEYEQADNYFLKVKKFIAQKKADEQKKDISIKIDDMFKAKLSLANMDNETDDDKPAIINKSYLVTNNTYMNERLNVNADLKPLNERSIKRITKDSYITLAYKIVLLMK